MISIVEEPITLQKSMVDPDLLFELDQEKTGWWRLGKEPWTAGGSPAPNRSFGPGRPLRHWEMARFESF
jgi:hypothetical protein